MSCGFAWRISWWVLGALLAAVVPQPCFAQETSKAALSPPGEAEPGAIPVAAAAAPPPVEVAPNADALAVQSASAIQADTALKTELTVPTSSPREQADACPCERARLLTALNLARIDRERARVEGERSLARVMVPAVYGSFLATMSVYLGVRATHDALWRWPAVVSGGLAAVTAAATVNRAFVRRRKYAQLAELEARSRAQLSLTAPACTCAASSSEPQLRAELAAQVRLVELEREINFYNNQLRVPRTVVLASIAAVGVCGVFALVSLYASKVRRKDERRQQAIEFARGMPLMLGVMAGAGLWQFYANYMGDKLQRQHRIEESRLKLSLSKLSLAPRPGGALLMLSATLH